SLELLSLGFGRRTCLKVDFRQSCTRPVPHNLAITFLRIAQEALSNVHRHAHAKSVRVSMSESRGWFQLQISDDGIGIPEHFDAAAAGVGVRGMAHRIETLGGRFSIR